MAQSYFVDSSGLVKRHVMEIGSGWFLQIAEEQTLNTIVISRLSIVEVLSAFNRRTRELSLSNDDYQKVAQDFSVSCQDEYQIIEISASVTNKARSLLEKYVLRASDSIQLASALLANENLTQEGFGELVFIASDERLLAAAKKENLRVENPLNHP